MRDSDGPEHWRRRFVQPRGMRSVKDSGSGSDDRGVADSRKEFASVESGEQPRSVVEGDESSAEVERDVIAGQVVELDPGRCRIWGVNRRSYEALTEKACRRLLDSIVECKGLLQPVLVRPVTDDEAVDYEVVFGVRRLWCVRWLREQGHAGIGLRATVREGLSDEEAFLMCDTENREREDFSAIERARMYEQAAREVYFGKTDLLADAVGLSQRRVTSFLAVARLPESVAGAFGDPRVASMKVWAQVLSILSAERRRTLRAAEKLAEEQAELAAQGKPFIPAREVLNRLVRKSDQVASAPVRIRPVFGKSGYELFRGKYDPVSGWALTIHPAVEGVAVEELVDALSRVISEHWPGGK